MAVKAGFKTVFRRIRGRIIPIRVSTRRAAPDEDQKIAHIRNALKFLRDKPTPRDSRVAGVLFKLARRQSKETGQRIGKRIRKLKGLK